MAGDDVQALSANPDIAGFAQILRPKDSEPPILSESVREAVRQWMVECNAVDELAAVKLKPRRTAMLSGPPGTGKTTLAHHIAARLGLPLVLIDMSALVGQYVGETGKNIHRLFAALVKQADRMVLLLDEFDAIAEKRSTATGSGAEKEKNAIIVHLLQHIDRFPGMMIAASNRADSIDPAIWRRFSMHLAVVEPDDECRYAIMSRYLDPMELPEAAMNILVELTAGASPALLRQLMEGVKRDLILAPRFKMETDAVSVFRRVTAAVQPHEGSIQPHLWVQDWAFRDLSAMPWPPTMMKAG